MKNQEPIAILKAWFAERHRLLLLVHERPDGDALGAQLGAHLLLEAAGHSCVSYLSQFYPQRYQSVFADTTTGLTFRWGDDVPSPDDFDGIVVFDTSTAARIDFPSAAPYRLEPREMCVIDHHHDNERFAAVNWVDFEYAAAAQMVADFAGATGQVPSAAAASALLVGIMTDCGGFRFRNTSADVLRTAAMLTDCGANPGQLSDVLFFNESWPKMRLKAELVETAETAHDGRLVYAVIKPETMTRLCLDPADTEDVIDVIRSLRGTEIACLIQPLTNGDIRISLRSRHNACDVSAIARKLGGGGHHLAAGARLRAVPLEMAIRMVIDLTAPLLEDSQ